MIHPSDIQPLTEFQRSAKTHIKHLRETGRPLMLTVNGRASVVVLDAEAYRILVERLAAADATHASQSSPSTGLGED